MRIIKFRAFDDGKMIYENNILHLKNEDNLVLRLAKFWCNIRNDSHVMQFTGLHYKNGKEIYEGEILYNNDREEHCIVKYSKEKAMFIVKYLESNDEFPLWESISNLCYSVGNIYENPELLTD